jgi:hypothetical protein
MDLKKGEQKREIKETHIFIIKTGQDEKPKSPRSNEKLKMQRLANSEVLETSIIIIIISIVFNTFPKDNWFNNHLKLLEIKKAL